MGKLYVSLELIQKLIFDLHPTNVMYQRAY